MNCCWRLQSNELDYKPEGTLHSVGTLIVTVTCSGDLWTSV